MVLAMNGLLPLLLLISKCGPCGTEVDPPIIPQVGLQVVANNPVWADTAYTYDMTLTVNNPSNVAIDSLLVSAKLYDTSAGGAVPSLASGPALASGTVTFDGGWTAVSPDTFLTTAVDTFSAGEAAVVTFTARFNHNGSDGPFACLATARAVAVDEPDSVATFVAGTAMFPPIAPENPEIGIAKVFGTVTGSSGAYAVPCSLFVENLGDVAVDSVAIADTLSSFDAGDATLTSITSKTTTHGTWNGGYDGLTDAQILVLADTEIASGEKDTVTFVVTWDEGSQTTFSNSATITAQGPSSQDLLDVSDWGHDPDPNGNGDPGDVLEGDPSYVNIPAQQGDAFDIVVDTAGVVVTGLTFHEGEADSSFVLSGAGYAAADSNAVEYTTQFSPLAYWPDGSVRLLRFAFVAPFGGTFDVVALSSPQSTTPVDISSDPGFYVTLNGVDYTFDATDFAESTDSASPVYREGYAEALDGGADYQGQPGGIKVMWWRRWNADGTARNFVGIRNRQVTSGAIQTAAQYSDASVLPAVWSLHQVAAADSFRIRWAVDAALGDGTNEADVVLWDSNSYDYPDISGAGSGEAYDFGGLLRAGEELWVEVTEGCDPSPPVAFETAARYASTHALPFTDTLVQFSSGTAWSSADSLRGYWESTCLSWVRNMDDETPRFDYWKNIRDVGVFYRRFDGALLFGDHSTGGDQYELNLGILKVALGTARVPSDTLSAWPTAHRQAWDLFEGSAVQHEAPKYNLDYSGTRDLRFAYGMTWPHVTHGTSGAGQQGRSNQDVHPNYYHGVALYPLWYLTGRPYLPEKITRVENLLHYVAISNWSSVNWAGEFRAGASGMNWTSTIYDMSGGAENLSDLMDAIRTTITTRDWGVPPLPNPCGTSWYGDKPWQYVYAVIALKQSIRVLYRWGATAEAQEAEGYLDTMQQFASDYAFTTVNLGSYDGGGPRTFEGTYYAWGLNDDDGQPQCFGVCTTECADYWCSVAGSAMVGFIGSSVDPADLIETGLLRRGSGASLEGWDEWHVWDMRDKGIQMRWSDEYFHSLGAPAKAQEQSARDGFVDKY